MIFSFFETKNITYFSYWREHLTFWKTRKLTGMRNLGNVKIFYSKAKQENIHPAIWLKVIFQYCPELLWFI